MRREVVWAGNMVENTELGLEGGNPPPGGCEEMAELTANGGFRVGSGKGRGPERAGLTESAEVQQLWCLWGKCWYCPCLCVSVSVCVLVLRPVLKCLQCT